MSAETICTVNESNKKAPLFVLSAGVLWGIIGIFSNVLSKGGMSPLQITESRCAVSAVCLFFYLLATDREKLKINIRDIWMFVGTGVCSIAFFNICYFTCINLTSLSTAAILLYTSPCFVMVLSCIIFKEKLTRLKLIALIVAFTGCAAVSGVFSAEMKITAFGLLVGLGSGLGYGLYSIFGRFALKKYTSLTIIFYTFLIAAVFLMPLCSVTQMAQITASNILLPVNMVLLGAGSTMTPFLLYTKGLSMMDSGRASVLAFAEPLTATAVSALVFGERLTAISITGICLILFGVFLLGKNEG